jgi:Na+/H+ antiporter NhaD/arsenite permease-like protein
VAERVWPILLFVVAITVVAELCALAGVFDVIAARVARVARGRTWTLWALVVLVAVGTTVFLSLDTTAVLLTPVVIVLARHVGVAPLPFALTTVWLANTGSLLLPVSNLTNLLALDALGNPSVGQFVVLLAVPALVGVLVPVVVLAIVFRRDLSGRHEAGVAQPPPDPVLVRSGMATLAVLLPLLVSGLPVWAPACGAALVLAAAFLVRRREALRVSLLPWQLVVFAAGLFLVVEAAQSAGLASVLQGVAGSGDSPLDLVRLSGISALGANAINNLPAYLAFEPLADSPQRMAALLVGVNAGSLITPWASLATMLWHERAASLGVRVGWSWYAGLGLVAAPLTVVLATLALALV